MSSYGLEYHNPNLGAKVSAIPTLRGRDLNKALQAFQLMQDAQRQKFQGTTGILRSAISLIEAIDSKALINAGCTPDDIRMLKKLFMANPQIYALDVQKILIKLTKVTTITKPIDPFEITPMLSDTVMDKIPRQNSINNLNELKKLLEELKAKKDVTEIKLNLALELTRELFQDYKAQNPNAYLDLEDALYSLERSKASLPNKLKVFLALAKTIWNLSAKTA